MKGSVFTRIRPAERRQTAGAFLVFLGIMAGHALLETARDALFLANVPATRLPWVYLGIAVLSLAGYLLYQRRTGGTSGGRWSLAAWLFSASAATFAFWLLVGFASGWVFYALYIWAGVAATLLVVRFWLFVQERFSVEQAKRLFPLIGAGSALGAILGSLAASFISIHLPSRSLLAASSATLAATAAGLLLFMPRSEPSLSPAHTRRRSVVADLGGPLVALLGNGYVRYVAALVFIPTIAFTFVDFLFKREVASALEPSGLASFFARTYLVLNMLSLLSQVFLSTWLIRKVGVQRALAVMPALLLAAAGGIAAGGGFAAAMILKGVDGTLRYSVHRTTTEVLYVPLAADLRSQIKGYIDSLGHRGGQAAASILILAFTATRWPEHSLGFVLIAFSAAWMVIALALRPHYMNLLRTTVSEAVADTRAHARRLDAPALESLIVALNSPEDDDVFATLDLLVERNKVRLIPALLLYHPSVRVVLRLLEIFRDARRRDVIPTMNRILRHPDPEVRAAVLRTRAALDAHAGVPPAADGDPSPLVRLTAAVIRVSSSDRAAVEKEAGTLAEIARGASEPEAVAIAESIEACPNPAFTETLVVIAGAESVGARCAAARAMRRMPDARFIPSLLRMLAERACRPDALATLVALDGAALRALEAFWTGGEGDDLVRRQLPAAVGGFPTRAAAPLLLARLVADPDGAVRYHTLRTLTSLRERDPRLPLDEQLLGEALEQTLRGALTILHWKLLLGAAGREDPARSTETAALLDSLIDHKVALDAERIFLLLDLLTPSDDLRVVFRSLRSQVPAVRAGALELLENLAPPRWRGPLMAVVEDGPLEERLAAAAEWLDPQVRDHESALRAVMVLGDSGLRSLAARHAAEIGHLRLRQEMERLARGRDDLVGRTLSRALERLAHPSPGGARHGP